MKKWLIFTVTKDLSQLIHIKKKKKVIDLMGILYPVLSAVVLFQKCSAWSPLNTQALETLDKFIHNLLTCPFSW